MGWRTTVLSRSRGLPGLMRDYAESLPFWGRTLAGDLLFSGALFGMYELLIRRTALDARTRHRLRRALF